MVMNGSQFSPLQHNQPGPGPGPDPEREDGDEQKKNYERKQMPNLYICLNAVDGWIVKHLSLFFFFIMILTYSKPCHLPARCLSSFKFISVPASRHDTRQLKICNKWALVASPIGIACSRSARCRKVAQCHTTKSYNCFAARRMQFSKKCVISWDFIFQIKEVTSDDNEEEGDGTQWD